MTNTDKEAIDMPADRSALLEGTMTLVQAENRTFLPVQKLQELVEAVRSLPESGAIVEAGCALGGSAAVLAAAKERSRRLYLYDVFGLIPAPRLRDGIRAWRLHLMNRLGIRKGIQGDLYYGYRENLLDEIKAFFARCGMAFEAHGVTAVQGRYQQTLAQSVPFEVAMAHIDCDWYDSVTLCLAALEPKLVPGGVIVLDDYYDFPGCRDALHDYLAKSGRGEEYSLEGLPGRSSMHVVRKKSRFN